jgi:3-(methylthio)propionyl---CoA ligase
MQSYGLTIDKFLDHAAKWHGMRAVIEADAGQVATQRGYADLRERSNRLSGALLSLGLTPGDRIGTLAWNTLHHFELYYGAMGAGLVCHTLNPRLTAEHLAAIINEAGERVLAASDSLLPLVEDLLPLCPNIAHVVVLDAPDFAAPDGVRVWAYEALLAERGAPAAWGAFDENAPAGLCYTSGTTGAPKGVLYTHRSNYLHTLRALQADAMGLTGADTVLLAVPMFHANAWGIPFSAAAVGASVVLPGRHMDGASLAALMRETGVTIALGVPTVWLSVADHLEATGETLPDLQRVLVGGSSCPDALIRRMEEKLGARVQTSWGMTELSPLGTIAPPGAPSEASGRAPMGLDLKLTDADGVALPEQRNVSGHLKVKGASVLDAYYLADSDALDAEGYFDTGDLAIIDDAGNLTISGRAKDLIKSGGEWINPTEIEAIVSDHETVGLAAVIGRADAKWGERPVLVVEPRQGQDIAPQSLVEALRGKVADWWLPGEVAVLPAIPLAATGKIDKARLRADYASGKIEGKRVRR